MKILKDCCVVLIKGYQWVISPIFLSLGVQCRFVPNCSEYAIKAIQEHGAIKGIFLGSLRLGKCHPFCKGGHDPVPPKFSLEKRHG
jgi:uncharacterized protein